MSERIRRINKEPITLNKWVVASGVVLLLVLTLVVSFWVYKKYYRPEHNQDMPKIVNASLYAVLCQNDDCFSLNKDGVSYSISPKTDGNLILNIIDKTGRILNLGEELLKPETIGELSFTKDKISRDLGVNFTKIETSDPNLEDFDLTTDKGWVLRLSINENAYKNIETLKHTLEQIKPADRLLLDYIDLRIPSKVYYKFK